MVSRVAPPPLTEIEWQVQVVSLARILGWKHLHVRRSIGKGRKWVTTTNVIGWPDLLLWHEKQVRVVAAELKTEKGLVTPEQEATLASLDKAGIEVYVWRPAMLEEVKQILTNGVIIEEEDQP